MIWIPIIPHDCSAGYGEPELNTTGSGHRQEKESGRMTATVSFFKKYFILRGQNAIIVSKDYSRTGGRISGDICVFGHGFLFI